MMIQPYLHEIEQQGEWSLVYINGQYSHAIHKRPAHGEFLVHAERGGSLVFDEPTKPIRDVADSLMERLHQAYEYHMLTTQTKDCPQHLPLYLRVDLIETDKWRSVISECEGVEPELFFRANPESLKLFVECLEQRLKSH